MECQCGHQSYRHYNVTYPKHRQPCDVCLTCGRTKPGPGKDCCLNPRRCPCRDFTKAQEAS